jgi:dTMP kinase
MAKGFFISIEGPDGGGKSTQTNLLCTRLREVGRTVLQTREIGGTPEAETIRDLVVRQSGGDWLPLSMMTMIGVARYEHTERKIKPALARGEIVVSDRYADSTYVYQVFCGHNKIDDYNQLTAMTLGNFGPDLTLILDVDPATSVQRIQHGAKQAQVHIKPGERSDDRFEAHGADLQRRTREGYLAIAAAHPERCVVIDATQSVEKVAEKLWAVVEQRINARG